jgi:co-chaperonin GroES (HSP10)
MKAPRRLLSRERFRSELVRPSREEKAPKDMIAQKGPPLQRTPDLEPLNGQIVVRRHQSPGESSGEHGAKIVLPDGAQEECQKATVLYTWRPYTDDEGTYHEPHVQPDEVVFLPRYGGQQFKLDDGQKIIFIEESKLLGVVREFAIHGGNGTLEEAVA